MSYSLPGEGLTESRPIVIIDTESKERLEFDSVSACARYLNMRKRIIPTYVKEKYKKKHNGKKYRIVYKSSLKLTN